MLAQLKYVLDLLEPLARRKIFIFSGLRVLLSGLDIIGVLLIGTLLANLANGFDSSTAESQSYSEISLPILGRMSLLETAFLAALAFLLKSILATFFTKVMLVTLANSESLLATKTFNKIMKNVGWANSRYSKSEIQYILSGGIAGAIEILVGTITIISEGTMLIAMLVSFLLIDFQTTVFIVLYFASVLYALNNYLGRKYRVAGAAVTTSTIRANSIVYDGVTAFREIRALKVEKFFIDHYEKPRDISSRANYQIQFLNNLPRYIVESSLIVGAFGLIYFTLKFNNLQESAKSIGIFLTGALRMMASVLPLQGSIGNFNHQIVRAKPFLDFVKSLDDHRQILDTSNQPSSKFEMGSVGLVIKDLAFKYEGSNDYAVKEIDLEISNGDFVALIGPSGSGKSTLADLIIGINRPASGSLCYFNDNKSELEINSFKIGYVPQSPGIISGTIKDNIAIGINESEIDFDALDRAIDQAQLRSLISDLPKGYESDLGKQQDGLSGGQLQRIGLARALYVNPSLLVLDEATSALDAESEAAVTESLNKLKGKCTVIVVAHRLSTVKNADIVHVMNDGKIVASGKFSELAKSNQMVARYVELSDIKST